MLVEALAAVPRVSLATLPTALERGPLLPNGARLWVKRDDLTGLGMGGNKARKLEYLCGDALGRGADTLVTVGAGQSNHCRMTAAAGALLGLPVHLVLGGAAPTRPTGNQMLSNGFGAIAHHAGTDDWDELGWAMVDLVGHLEAEGRHPASIPIGGSTPVGALGFAAAMVEVMDQTRSIGVRFDAIVHTTSSGGTHAGLVAGRAALRAEGHDVPDILAVGVAKGVLTDHRLVGRLAERTLGLLGLEPSLVVDDDVVVVDGFMGDGYAVPTRQADEAIRWAARHGAWVLDRVYTGKGFAGLLALEATGRWGPGDDVVFWHTGGQPAVFADGGWPP